MTVEQGEKQEIQFKALPERQGLGSDGSQVTHKKHKYFYPWIEDKEW